MKEHFHIEHTAPEKILGTDITITAYTDAPERVSAAIDAAFSFLRDFDQRFSRFRNDNELSRFNNATYHHASQDLCEILKLCNTFIQETDGLFNPFIAYAVLEHIGYTQSFHGITPQKPRSTPLHAPILQWSFDQETCIVQKNNQTHLDLGGIGKGFAVDRVAQKLLPVTKNFLINAGGDIFVHGTENRENHPFGWSILVENPLYPEQQIAEISHTCCGIATSGINRRQWRDPHTGRLLHHIIDPRISASAKTDILSATVIAENCTTADVWAKTLLIAGSQDVEKIILHHNLAAIIVYADGKIFYSPQARCFL